ncbi:hypothetical protein FM038_014080 [Shewanella eurypsychrophilus]|uniref:Uncharacterized protein n=1 Tax=Shewanella eurypsychrophilus TaxID=2593656 RepID=A0ABX6V743_9GAMM|nr:MULTISPECIES: hypothetical protein [Shewanella]QFU23163.1 hypothetical protein FS418_15660 [Shewanella sp. YLB-09]QPG58446.1 hypothetical protein FM038_014080 [Shewanella eurypsychrophilus]
MRDLFNLAILSDSRDWEGNRTQMAKTFTPKGKTSYANAYTFDHNEVQVTDINELHDLLVLLESNHSVCVVRAKPNAVGVHQRTLENMTETSRLWVCLDFDTVPLPDHLNSDKTNGGVLSEYLIQNHLNNQFHNASYHWQFSSSHGMDNFEMIKMHLWFFVSEPMGWRDWDRYFDYHGDTVDRSVFRTVQVHYTANPTFIDVVDPVPVRSGLVHKKPLAMIHKLEQPLYVEQAPETKTTMTLEEAEKLISITTDPKVKMMAKSYIQDLKLEASKKALERVNLLNDIINRNIGKLHHVDIQKLMAALIAGRYDDSEIMLCCSKCLSQNSGSDLTKLMADIKKAGAKCGYTTLRKFAGR